MASNRLNSYLKNDTNFSFRNGYLLFNSIENIDYASNRYPDKSFDAHTKFKVINKLEKQINAALGTYKDDKKVLDVSQNEIIELRQQLEKMKRKNEILKERARLIKRDYVEKTQLLEKKMAEYDKEISIIEVYKQQIQEALSEYNDSKLYSKELFKLRNSLKEKMNNNNDYNIKQRLLNIIEYANKEHINLKTNHENTMESISKQIQEIFWYIVEESKEIKQKYKKLLKLHNHFIQNSTTIDDNYNAEYIYKLVDENDFLRKELGCTIYKTATHSNTNEDRRVVTLKSKKLRRRRNRSSVPKKDY